MENICIQKRFACLALLGALILAPSVYAGDAPAGGAAPTPANIARAAAALATAAAALGGAPAAPVAPAAQASYPIKRIVAAVPLIAAAVMVYSKDARDVASEAYYKSLIFSLRMLNKLPLSENKKETINNYITATEDNIHQRGFNGFTADKAKAIIKECVDAGKAVGFLFKMVAVFIDGKGPETLA